MTEENKIDNDVGLSSSVLKKIAGITNITNDQKKALQEINNFLGNKHEHIFTLAGYAGTGKTTIASLIASIATSKHKIKHIMFCASTNKALQVLKGKVYNSRKYTFRTAYSFLYSTRYRKHSYESKVKDRSEIKYGLIICDESSMISNTMLDDMSDFIAENHNKIIYIGDSFQLPAVKDNQYSVFDFKNMYIMTDVCRQAKNSGILAYATDLRTKKKIVRPDEKYSQYADIHIDDGKSLWNKYLDDLKNNKNSSCIVFQNKTRVAVNNGARAFLGYSKKDEDIQPKNNEILISIANSEIGYNNGETFTFDESYKYVASGTVHYYGTINGRSEKIATQMYLYFKTGKNKECSIPLIVVPKFFEPSVYHYQFVVEDIIKLFDGDESKKMMKYFIIQDESKSSKRKKKNITSKLNSNAVIATYGYAITAHKAQGSQWNTVYVMERQNSFNEENNARWLYTAITRASKELYINKDIFK